MSMGILIADDDPIFRTALVGRLAASRPFEEVWEAGDGEEAVLLAFKLHPDLILMGLTLPRIGGLEATQLIKSKLPGVRIIVVSTFLDNVYEQAARTYGADSFVGKSMCWSFPDRPQAAPGEHFQTRGGGEDAPARLPSGDSSTDGRCSSVGAGLNDHGGTAFLEFEKGAPRPTGDVNC